jgi:hypothetical protein
MRRAIFDGTHHDRMVGAMPGRLDAFLGEEFDEEEAAIVAADAATIAAERVASEHLAELDDDPGSIDDDDPKAAFARGFGDDEELACVDDWRKRSRRASSGRRNE